MKTIIVDREPVSEINDFFYFPTQVSIFKTLKFLPIVRQAVEKELNSLINPNFNFPVQTGNLSNYSELQEYNQFILDASWQFLDRQGYNVSNFSTFFIEHWIHFHPKFSYVEKHRHGLGSQVSGVYILKFQNNKMSIFDPRNGLSQMLVHQKDTPNITCATTNIFFDVEPGNMYFFNSWLEHSFDINQSDEPLIFTNSIS